MSSDRGWLDSPRYVLPAQPQHLIPRGNNREPIFAQAADYAFYLKKLKLACEPHTSVIHAYVLMTNHVHLLMTPTSQEGMGKVMQRPGRYYVQYFNYVYDRTSTLCVNKPGSDHSFC